MRLKYTICGTPESVEPEARVVHDPNTDVALFSGTSPRRCSHAKVTTARSISGHLVACHTRFETPRNTPSTQTSSTPHRRLKPNTALRRCSSS